MNISAIMSFYFLRVATLLTARAQERKLRSKELTSLIGLHGHSWPGEEHEKPRSWRGVSLWSIVCRVVRAGGWEQGGSLATQEANIRGG